ncbi:MAG: hypothetical protein WCY84_05260 [Candidatus Cloacimonadaceae bacterium]
MRYLSIIILSLMLLLIASCDRFEHAFQPEGDHILIAQLNEAFGQISAEDMSALEALYSDDYLHSNDRKQQRIAWYRSLLTIEDLRLEATQIEYKRQDANHGILNWRVLAFSGETVVADSSFIGERVERISGNRWEILGDRIVWGEDLNPQLVIAEYFTFRTCPHCPAAEEKLNQLHTQYPENFIYLEHHVSMELALPGNTVPAYYGAWSQPAAVFKGREKVNGSTADKLAEYQSIVDTYVRQESPISYSLRNTLLNGNTLSGRVKLSVWEGLDTTDLYLNYVVISNEDHYTNANNQPLHNVVRGLGSHSLADADFNELQEFSLSVRTETFPDEYTLVIFAQKRPTTFNNDATIYGGLAYKSSKSARRK